MSTTLSSLKEKVNEARCPLPLFTCLHVKPDVSELMFAGMLSHLSEKKTLEMEISRDFSLCLEKPKKKFISNFSC